MHHFFAMKLKNNEYIAETMIVILHKNKSYVSLRIFTQTYKVYIVNSFNYKEAII
jgi:hypothetical protein